MRRVFISPTIPVIVAPLVEILNKEKNKEMIVEKLAPNRQEEIFESLTRLKKSIDRGSFSLRRKLACKLT